MLRFFKSFFVKAKQPESVAPYKVEPPAPLAPAYVNPEVFPNLAVDGHGDVHEVKAKPKSVRKAPAKKKPAAMKAPAKPKTPRKPKVTK